MKFGFPVGYDGLIPTPTVTNHSLDIHHPCDMAAYITKEVREGGHMKSPLSPIGAGSTLLMRPKKDSHLCRVIMDLSWPSPVPTSALMAVCPRKCIWGHYKKMHLPTATDMTDLIWQAG